MGRILGAGCVLLCLVGSLPACASGADAATPRDGRLATRITVELPRATVGHIMRAVAEAADLQLVAEAVPGAATSFAVRNAPAGDVLDQVAARFGLEWQVAGEKPVVVVRKAGAQSCGSAPGYFGLLDTILSAKRIDVSVARAIARTRLSEGEAAALSAVCPSVSPCLANRCGTALLACLGEGRAVSLLAGQAVVPTAEEAAAIWGVFTGLVAAPSGIAPRALVAGEAATVAITVTGGGGAVEVEVPKLPLPVEVWDRPLAGTRAKVEMEGAHEGRNDRVLTLDAEDAELGAVLRLISGMPTDSPPEAGTRNQWFAIVSQRNLGEPRITCRLRDVATRHDLLPALAAAFRCKTVAGLGFFLLVPDPSPEVVLAGVAAAGAVSPVDSFGGWLAPRPKIDLATAAVQALGVSDSQALLTDGSLDVAFADLSAAGRAAFVACDRQRRALAQSGALSGPLLEVDWAQADKLFVRLSRQPQWGLQATCIAVTRDGIELRF